MLRLVPVLALLVAFGAGVGARELAAGRADRHEAASGNDTGGGAGTDDADGAPAAADEALVVLPGRPVVVDGSVRVPVGFLDRSGRGQRVLEVLGPDGAPGRFERDGAAADLPLPVSAAPRSYVLVFPLPATCAGLRLLDARRALVVGYDAGDGSPRQVTALPVDTSALPDADRGCP